jgi:3',5'-cyclic AMP phosphodiesterase CpdA
MKFIHTADLHLDSPLRGLSAYADAPAERLRTATRDAFQNLVTQAIDEQVDFMVIAGDVYDGKRYGDAIYAAIQRVRLSLNTLCEGASCDPSICYSNPRWGQCKAASLQSAWCALKTPKLQFSDQPDNLNKRVIFLNIKPDPDEIPRHFRSCSRLHWRLRHLGEASGCVGRALSAKVNVLLR